MIDDAEGAKAFAAKSTSPSEARGAAPVFQMRSSSASRRVLDVSGDGPNNTGPPVRNVALKRGIVINGLLILIRPLATGVAIDQYYSKSVVDGPGSFMLPVTAPEDFAIALQLTASCTSSGMAGGRSPAVLTARDVR